MGDTTAVLNVSRAWEQNKKGKSISEKDQVADGWRWKKYIINTIDSIFLPIYMLIVLQ